MHGVTCVDRAWDRERDLALARPEQRRRCNMVQAAEIAGVSRRTIFNWMRAGKVEYVRTPMGGVRIYVDTLLLPPKK